MNQCDKVLDFMEKHGEISQRDAYRMGIYRLASRISDLKGAGTAISSEMRKVSNRDGSTSYVAFYRLTEASGGESND